jgi:hypothetical protein
MSSVLAAFGRRTAKLLPHCVQSSRCLDSITVIVSGQKRFLPTGEKQGGDVHFAWTGES